MLKKSFRTRVNPSKTKIVTRVSELIGNTPLLQLIETVNGSRVLLKLEQFNPTGSAKIRMAKQMLDEAEQQGVFRRTNAVVESTSGNTGMGLALMAAERGLSFTAVVDRHSAKEKILAMQAYGAHIEYVVSDDSCLATKDRDQQAAEKANTTGAFWTEQHNNSANARGYVALAAELYHSLGRQLTHLVGAVGTGGSLCGTSAALKVTLPDLQVLGVEPIGSIIFGGKGGDYFQSGTGTPEGAEVGTVVDYAQINQALTVSDKQAFNTARFLAKRLGLLVGGSAGGVIYKALNAILRVPAGSTMVVLVCDGGEKYLDTVFNDTWMQSHQLISAEIEQTLAAIFLQAEKNAGCMAETIMTHDVTDLKWSRQYER